MGTDNHQRLLAQRPHGPYEPRQAAIGSPEPSHSGWMARHDQAAACTPGAAPCRDAGVGAPRGRPDGAHHGQGHRLQSEYRVALLRDADEPARPIDNDHRTSTSRCRTSGGHPLRPRGSTRARDDPRLFAAPDSSGAKRPCPVARREDCPSSSMTAVPRSSSRRTQPRSPTRRVSLEGGQGPAESNRARTGRHPGPAGRPRSVPRRSVHSVHVRDRQIRVTLRIIDQPLKRCTWSSTGAASQVHGRRELALRNPSVHGRTTQRSDPDHVGHAKECRTCRGPELNVAAVGIVFECMTNPRNGARPSRACV